VGCGEGVWCGVEKWAGGAGGVSTALIKEKYLTKEAAL